MNGVRSINIPKLLVHTTGVHNGIGSDTATYGAPNPDLPTYLGLIQNLAAANAAVRARTMTAAARDLERDLLWTATETQRSYVQSIADRSPSRAVVIIQTAGFVVARPTSHGKGIIELRDGKQSGTLVCDANVGILLGPGAVKPSQSRFFNWQYTPDASRTFVTVPSTPTGKTMITGLTPLTVIGVRVSMTSSTGTGPWSRMCFLRTW